MFTSFLTSKMIFYVLSFRLAIFFVLISRFAKYLPIPSKWYKTPEDKLSIQRIIGISLLLVIVLVAATVYFKDLDVVEFFFDSMSIDL